MELSKMFGVERGEKFMVEGGGKTLCKIIAAEDNVEYLLVKFAEKHRWEVAGIDALLAVINIAPSGIIHLPPPLTDEQREQLKAIWTLGGRWLAKGKDDKMFAYDVHPVRSDSGYWRNCSKIFRVSSRLAICGLVSPNSTIPYDIGKALEVGE